MAIRNGLVGIALAGWLALAAAGGALTDKEQSLLASRKNYWAFKRLTKPEIPANAAKNPIDAFILENLQAHKLTASAPLAPEQLVRRAYLDLTGLPPTPAEARAFLEDRSGDAYTKLIDRLMASPHYGERIGLKWLDVVRYADTNGFEADKERPNAWRYRDYVVQAFNQDMPYDRFVQEQLAGDELFPGDPESLIALGFLRCGPRHLVGGNQDPEMSRQEDLVELAGSVGSTFLGLTVGCARCHDHKFDPILQSDYYRLQAIFAATDLKDLDIATAAEKTAHEARKKAYEARLKPVADRIAAMEEPYKKKLRQEKVNALDAVHSQALAIPKDQRTAEQQKLAKEAEDQVKVPWDEILAAMPAREREQRAEVRRELHRLELEAPAPLKAAFAVANMEKDAPETHILKAGDYRLKLGAVDPGFLAVLAPWPVEAPKTIAGRRSALAKWLTSPECPLTARVMANRIWELRTGSGLVKTPNDFGLLGGNPSNQKLLDWLAVEFVSNGWSVKHLDRLILLSNTYRQSSESDAAKAAIDPGNRYFWRMNHRRLDAESLRDSTLEVTGLLNPKQGGAPVRVPVEPEVAALVFTEGEPDNLWPVTPDPSEHNRRALYLLNKRSVRLPLLANFDQPDAMTSCPARPVSTHALQALSLMNGDFMRRQSAAFAQRLRKECGDRNCEVARAYELALSREPKTQERYMASRFFSAGSPLEDFCLALLNRNEYAYIP